MELILQKVCGRPAQLPIRLRRCGPADAAAFFALQNEVRAAMPHPEQFVPDTLENITAYLRKDLCIGAYDGERLGAYFILRYCGRSAHNYAAFLGVPREEWEHWANADSAIVHADFRGNGLQRLMLEAALPQPVSAPVSSAPAISRERIRFVFMWGSSSFSPCGICLIQIPLCVLLYSLYPRNSLPSMQ